MSDDGLGSAFQAAAAQGAMPGMDMPDMAATAPMPDTMPPTGGSGVMREPVTRLGAASKALEAAAIVLAALLLATTAPPRAARITLVRGEEDEPRGW
jgi:hypothetical protein